jgi:DNA-nicking Smr family endonuclease
VSKGGRELTPEERKLWRRVAASVRSRRARGAAPTSEADATPAPVRQAPPGLHAPPPRAGAHSAPPPDRAREKRIRRGRVEIGATLDLHGHTLQSGREALARFLRAAQARGERTVIVVTGVGRSGEGVLRRSLPEWLGQADIRPLTSGYAQAHRAHGGAGAFYVFITRPRGRDS